MSTVAMAAVNSIKARFPSNGDASLAKGIPIEMLDMVKWFFKEAGIDIRVKYRGPRKNQIGIMMRGVNGVCYRRHAEQAQATCLKAYATSFAVYRK
jgi:hypothetical protein